MRGVCEIASAYSALCESFRIPVLEMIQFGGNWDQIQRKLDELPWRGWLSISNPNKLYNFDTPRQFEEISIEEVVLILRQRKMHLSSYLFFI